MEARASIPVSLPHPSPTTSYWQDPPSPIAAHESSSRLPEEADVVIIGSGITGAAVAWNLLQKQVSEHRRGGSKIVMLEARGACSGATGRNGISLSIVFPTSLVFKVVRGVSFVFGKKKEKEKEKNREGRMSLY